MIANYIINSVARIYVGLAHARQILYQSDWCQLHNKLLFAS